MHPGTTGESWFVGTSNLWGNLVRDVTHIGSHLALMENSNNSIYAWYWALDWVMGEQGFFFLSTSIITSPNNLMTCTPCFLDSVKQLFIRLLLAATNTYPNTRQISDSGSCLISCCTRGKFIWLGLGVNEVRCCWGLEKVTAGSPGLRVLMLPIYLHG